jgi:hypothetical protein
MVLSAPGPVAKKPVLYHSNQHMVMFNSITGTDFAKNVTGRSASKMGILTGGLAFGFSALKSVDHIPPNEVGVLVRGGRLTQKRDTSQFIRTIAQAYGYGDYEFLEAGDYYGYKGNGLAFSIPLLERRVRVNVGENRDKLETQHITSQEEMIMAIGSTAVWNVMGDGLNPIKSLMILNDPLNKNNFSELRQTVKAISQEGLANVMSGLPVKAMSNFDEIRGNVIDLCGDRLGEYGVRLAGLEFEAPFETSWSANSRAIRENARSIARVAEAIERSGGAATHAASDPDGKTLVARPVAAVVNQGHLFANGNGYGEEPIEIEMSQIHDVA